MSIESTAVHFNPREYFEKMSANDAATITSMCLNRLCIKSKELAELYEQLSKTYSVEMSVCGITLLVQVSSPVLPFVPVHGLFGTTEGIEHALTVVTKTGAKDLVNMKKEEEADENG